MDNPKSIAELWSELQKNIHGVGHFQMKLKEEVFDHYKPVLATMINTCEQNVSTLRVELSNRCCGEFGMIIYNGVLSMPPRTKMTIDEADDLVAALGFMAYEMKQQLKAKEVQNG